MFTDIMDSKPLMGMKIYVEIFNNGFEEKDLLDEYIIRGGGVIVKRLSEKIDYIVFKEGNAKTIQYAMDKGIIVVNPLWVNDKMYNCFKGTDAYIINNSYNDVCLDINYGSKNAIRKKSAMNKENKGLFEDNKNNNNQSTKNQKGITSIKNNSKNADNNNQKITSFFSKI